MSNRAPRLGFIATLGLSFAAASVLSCSGPQTATSQAKIYGGVKTNAGEWLSTVAVVSGNRMYCTGTAIHPLVVITAAHCVQGDGDPSEFSIYVGDGSEGGNVAAEYNAIKVAYSPKYGRNATGWNDIAYIVLDKPLNLPPSAYIPVLTNPDEIAELLQTGRQTHLVGFGNRDTDGGGFGVKYEVDAEITQVGDNEVSLGKDGKDSCQGDSGGPAYAQLNNGEWRVFGVVSRGGACGTGGIYGRMNANICWVQQDSGVDLGFTDYCQSSAL